MLTKRYSHVLNLPIIDLEEGTMLGKLKTPLINAQEKRVAAFEVSGRPPLKQISYFLPYQNIKRIGPDAVIVSGATALKEKISTEDVVALGEPNLVSKKVISEEGNLLGIIKDYSFNEQGVLHTLYMSGGLGEMLLKGEQPVSAHAVVKVGRDFIIITEDAAEVLEEEEPEATAFNQIKNKGKAWSHSLEVRAIEYAHDKRVKQNIYSPEGGVIIKKGEQVTPETIDIARQQGRLPHLLIAAGVGDVIEALDIPREKLDTGSKRLVEFWERLKSRGTSEETEEAPPLMEDAEEPLVAEDTDADKDEVEDFLNQIQSVSRSTAAKIEETSREKMRRFLLAKHAADYVHGPGGEVLAEKGQYIDEETINRADEMGLLSHLFIGIFRDEVHNRLTTLKDIINTFMDRKD